MPFHMFALIVIAVLAASALSVWAVATLAIQFSWAPVPAFGIFAVLVLAVALIVRRRNG